MVKIVKFGPDLLTFEHEGSVILLILNVSFIIQELSEILLMSLDEVKKYKV